MVQSSMCRSRELIKESIAMGFALPCDGGSELSSFWPFFLAMTGTAWLLVIMTNAFIIVANLSDWSKGKRLMPNDEILSSLAMSNLCHATSLITEYFCSLLWYEFYTTSHNMQKVTITLDIVTSFSSFWFTAWLSVFYCLKIVSFKQPFLLKIKLKLPGLVRLLLLGSALVSLGAALLFQCALMVASHREPVLHSSNQTTSLPSASNCTFNHVKAKFCFVYMSAFSRALIIVLGCSVPLMLVVCSSVPVLCSLFRHTQKLERTLPPSHLEGHVKAAQAVQALLLCDIILFVCQALLRAEAYQPWNYQYFLCLMVHLVTFLAQSTILIRSNSKLKQMCAHLLSCLLC